MSMRRAALIFLAEWVPVLAVLGASFGVIVTTGLLGVVLVAVSFGLCGLVAAVNWAQKKLQKDDKGGSSD